MLSIDYLNVREDLIMNSSSQEACLQDLRWSRHAQQRQQQRGFQAMDTVLLQSFGEYVEDGYLMTNQSVAEAQQFLKKMLQRLDHIRGATLIESEGTVITASRADKKRVRRLRMGHVEAA